MQILTRQTKQGASISGRRQASKEKAVIGKSDLLFVHGSVPRKSGSGLTSAGLAHGTYPLQPGWWRTKHSGGVILHHLGQRGANGWAMAFLVGPLQSGQSAATPPVRSSLSFAPPLIVYLGNQERFPNHSKRGQIIMQVDFQLLQNYTSSKKWWSTKCSIDMKGNFKYLSKTHWRIKYFKRLRCVCMPSSSHWLSEVLCYGIGLLNIQ